MLPTSMLLLIVTLMQKTYLSHGLEARWTPAADGGPARFSKRYRDSQGIDDSKWYSDGEAPAWWLPQMLPEGPTGWISAIIVALCIYALYHSQQPRAYYATGGRTDGKPPSSEPAAEAARAAFVKKYG